MEDVFESLYANYAKGKNKNAGILEMEIDLNKKRLKKNFNKNQMKLLLRIIDGKGFA